MLIGGCVKLIWSTLPPTKIFEITIKKITGIYSSIPLNSLHFNVFHNGNGLQFWASFEY
jgi:hypothetical protein